MPSENSLKSAVTFLGTLPQESVRQEWSLGELPHDDEGLRLLAADANWSGVALLAEELSAPHGGRGDGETHRDLAARLRYVLVQVTAYFKMHRYADAKRVIDGLGNLKSDRFIDPETNSSVVPFSLLFLSALLPSYCDATADSQYQLYILLEECRKHVVSEASPIWKARVKRVQRALIVNHYQMEQYSNALRLFEETIAEMRYDDGEGGGADYMVLQQMLHLQQFATLCIHCGNVFLAEDVFKAIQQLDTADETDDVQKFHRFLLEINRAIWLSFNDRADEAAHIFREVARGAREFCSSPVKMVQSSSTVPTASSQGSSASSGAKIQSELCRMAFRQLWVTAATSHMTCMPYGGMQWNNPATLMTSIIDTMEGYLRQDPVELLHSDAFLGNSVRLYTLEGNTQEKKVELLEDLLEVFRCDRKSAPSLKKML